MQAACPSCGGISLSCGEAPALVCLRPLVIPFACERELMNVVCDAPLRTLLHLILPRLLLFFLAPKASHADYITLT